MLASWSAFLTEADDEVAAPGTTPKRWCPRGAPWPTPRRRCRPPATRSAELTAADFAADVLEGRCRAAAERLGWKAGDFFRPLRIAITGRSVSPPLFGSMELLGRDRVLARLDAALRKASLQESLA